MFIKELPDIMNTKKLIETMPFGATKTYRYLKTGKLKSMKFGGTYFVKKSDVLDFFGLSEYNGTNTLSDEAYKSKTVNIEREVKNYDW